MQCFARFQQATRADEQRVLLLVGSSTANGMHRLRVSLIHSIIIIITIIVDLITIFQPMFLFHTHVFDFFIKTFKKNYFGFNDSNVIRKLLFF